MNMMCGKRDFGPGWTHVDIQPFAHVVWADITMSIFLDHSVDLIYCSHGIAYFDREEIVLLLKRWHSKLRPGGVLRLSTPDWDVLKTLDKPLLGPLYGKMSDPPIYHRTVYTERELTQVLHDSGFGHVRRYDHKKTDHAQHDDHSAAYYQGKLISLNIECNA